VKRTLWAGLAALVSILLLAGPAAAQRGPQAPSDKSARQAPAAPQQPPDVPSGPGSLSGRVLRTGGVPLPGIEVVLYALSEQGPGLRRARSDADGHYHFAGISTDPAIGWLLGARYQGVPFPGGRVRFGDGGIDLSQDVHVSDLTKDPHPIHVAEVSLQLSRGGAGGALRVAETLHLRNDGEATFYVRAGERHGAPAVRAELPKGATSFNMPLGVVPEGLERHGARLRYWGPVYPGSQELTYSYTLAAGQDPEEVHWRPLLPSGAAQVTVLLPEGLGTWTAKGWKELKPRKEMGRSQHVLVQTQVRPGAALRASLHLPAARLDPSAVALEEVRLVVQMDDAALHVTETHTLQVKGDSPILGTAKAPLLQVALPAKATDLRFGSDGSGVRLIPAKAGGLAAVGTATPGELHVEMAYRLPIESLPARLERSFRSPVPLLSVFLADTGRLVPHSERLHRRRPVATQDQTYMHLEAFEVAAGEPVRLQIGVRAAPSTPSPTVVRGASGVAAIAIILLLVAPLRRSGVALASAEQEPETRRERESLYAAIRDLDHDHETGKLSDSDHIALRGQLRARAMALLREEQREASSATSPTPAGLHCQGCGEAMEASHRFCPHCGAPQEESPSAEASG